MTPELTTLRPARRVRSGAVAIAAVLIALATAAGVTGVTLSHAQGGVATQEQGVRWRDLNASQQAALKPLEREWSGIDPTRKQKWIELSGTYAKRSPAEQQRIQERMSEWARLSPQERSQARLHFQEATQLTPQDRKNRWDAYQALPPEKKQQLAERAAPAPKSATPSKADAPQLKSNIVPNPAYATPPKVVAPTVVQARPGATTTPINKRPSPPSHQQTGLPKIAATPEFVNKATLLPRRGPQGAATRAATGPASEPRAAQ